MVEALDSLPIVEIRWVDSQTHSGWGDTGDSIDKTLAKCRSVGYILDKNEERISLVQNLAPYDDQVGDIICIPIVSISEMIELNRTEDNNED